MTQKYLATWPESPKRVRKKILTHAKDTPRSHTKLLSSPSRDLASLGMISVGIQLPLSQLMSLIWKALSGLNLSWSTKKTD